MKVLSLHHNESPLATGDVIPMHVVHFLGSKI